MCQDVQEVPPDHFVSSVIYVCLCVCVLYIFISTDRQIDNLVVLHIAAFMDVACVVQRPWLMPVDLDRFGRVSVLSLLGFADSAGL